MWNDEQEKETTASAGEELRQEPTTSEEWQAEYEELKSAYNDLLAAAEEAKEKEAQREDALTRARADYDNLKRRSQEHLRTERERVTGEILLEILPLIDIYEHVLTQYEHAKDEPFYKGIEMLHTKFIGLLEQYGLQEIEALGQMFDYHLHDAKMRLAVPDKPEGEIVQVIRKGYQYRDGKVLRVAEVVVAYPGE
ncbi:MAG: nucleotide exchange factor GrpE [Veillonellaceae bacterium]|nr:nucleotide exchange factor GrpE [Veillonellaceae bacterium]